MAAGSYQKLPARKLLSGCKEAQGKEDTRHHRIEMGNWREEIRSHFSQRMMLLPCQELYARKRPGKQATLGISILR
jgi:surfactin synthase thioesterase subunit